MPIRDNTIAQIQFRYRLHGQRCINTFYYRALTGGPPDVPTMTEEFTDLWDSTHTGAITQVLSEEVSDIRVRGQLLEPNGALDPTRYMFYERAGTPAEGVFPASSLPSTCAAVVRKRTDLAGHANRGRIFVAGVPLPWEQDSLLTAVARGEYDTAYGPVFLNPLLVLGIQWDPVLTNPPLHSVSREITQVSVDDVIRVQRRREVGVGE